MDILQQGIIRFEPGIIEKEGIYFHTASAFAQQHLFYSLWVHVIFAVRRTACASKTFELHF